MTHPRPVTRHRIAARGTLFGVLALAAGFGAVLMGQAAGSGPTARANVASTTQPTTDQAAAEHREQDIARVMEFFRITQPDVYDQALTFKETDPARFEKLVRGAVGTVNRLETLRKQDPALFDLKMQDLTLAYKSMRLAKELQKQDLPAADHDRLMTEMTAVVTTEFDVAQQMREHEIAYLKSRLTDLDKQLQDRANDKDALIKQRTQDLLQKAPPLDW